MRVVPTTEFAVLDPVDESVDVVVLVVAEVVLVSAAVVLDDTTVDVFCEMI